MLENFNLVLGIHEHSKYMCLKYNNQFFFFFFEKYKLRVNIKKDYNNQIRFTILMFICRHLKNVISLGQLKVQCYRIKVIQCIFHMHFIIIRYWINTKKETLLYQSVKD